MAPWLPSPHTQLVTTQAGPRRLNVRCYGLPGAENSPWALTMRARLANTAKDLGMCLDVTAL